MALKTLKSSLWVITKPFVQPTVPSALLMCSVAVLGLLFGNLVAACAFTFDCKRFLPTISYAAAYRWHDRFTSVALTLHACALSIFFGLVYCTNLEKLSKSLGVVQLASGLCVCLSLMLLSLFDEVESIIFLAFGSHAFIISVLAGGLTTWLVIQILAEPDKTYLHNYASFLLLMLTCTWLEHSFSSLKGFCFNSNLEALCEWSTIFAFVMLPTVYLKGHPEVHCEIGTDILKEALK
jgi:hypothetical protein